MTKLASTIEKLTNVRDEAGKTIKFLSMDEAVKLKSRDGQYVRLTGDDIKTEIRQVDRDKLQVEFVISSYRRDDYGTRFEPTGCDLSQYRMNPIVLYRHMRDGGEYTLPIARGLVETLSIDADGKMHMVCEFTPESTFPFGFQVYKLVRDGFLNMASIGAQIMGEEILEEANGMKTIVFTKWKLFEWSVVPIGANDDALVASREKSGEQEAEEKSNEINEFLSQRIQKMNTSVTVVRSDSGSGIVTMTTNGEVTICKDVEIPETEDQKKHREYFTQFSKVSKAYRSLMEKLYKRVGLVPNDNEEDAVKRITELVLCAGTITDTIRTKVRETRVPTPDEIRSVSAKLVATVEGKKREALRSGTPLSKIDTLVPQWTKEAIDSISSPTP